MKRELVIGDIHGGLKALQQVLKRARVTDSDELVFLGDYVDGWSESAEVLDFLLELEKTRRCTFLKGNHDIWCEDWLRTSVADPKWLMRGGQATISSYAKQPASVKNRHLAFFERMRFFRIDAQNRLFIHAGFTSAVGPSHDFDQPPYRWDRTLWEEALAAQAAQLQPDQYPPRLQLFKEIFIGHTPTINYGSSFPMCVANIWNIDTGSAFYGPLSVLDVDSHEFWQSDPVMMLYPDEPGRGRT